VKIARLLILALMLSLFGAALTTLAESRSSLAHWLYGDESRETIALIHGFNDSHETWNKIVPALSKRYRVLTYDQPGHGKSKAEGSNFSPQRMASDLKSLLDSLGIKSAHIVGHSMGGRTALEFGARYPQMAKSVLVEDMSAFSDPDSVKALPKMLEKFDRVKKGIPNTFKSYTAAAFALSNYYSFDEVLWILAAAKTLPDGSMQLGNRPEVTALYLHQGLAQDMTSQLKSIRAPLMFFAGDPNSLSTVLGKKAIQHIRSVRPDVDVKVFPKSGHMVHNQPEFVESLLRFLEHRDDSRPIEKNNHD
jgi:pimeloyl-ACP methyl ester carboxylesterase